jgi:hypothetical protein
MEEEEKETEGKEDAEKAVNVYGSTVPTIRYQAAATFLSNDTTRIIRQ